MKYLIIFACVAFALSQPLNEKRFFNIFGGDEKTTENPNKARLEDLKEQLKLANEHITAHGRNITNSTNAGLDRVANVLDILGDKASQQLVEVEEGLESLRNQLEEQLARSAKFIRNGKEHLGKMHEAISDEFNHHMSSIEDLAHKIKPKN